MVTETNKRLPVAVRREVNEVIKQAAQITVTKFSEAKEVGPAYHEQYRKVLALREEHGNHAVIVKAINHLETLLITQYQETKWKLIHLYTRNRSRGVSSTLKEDLSGWGDIGLLGAIRSWDHSNDSALLTWIYLQVRKQIQIGLAQETPLTSLTDEGYRTKVLEAVKVLKAGGGDPSVKDISEYSGASPACVSRILDFNGRGTPASLDQIVDGTENLVLSDVLVEDQNNIQEDIPDADPEALKQLKVLDLFMIIRAFGLDGAPKDTLSSLKVLLGKSPDAIRKSLSDSEQALAKASH